MNKDLLSDGNIGYVNLLYTHTVIPRLTSDPDNECFG